MTHDKIQIGGVGREEFKYEKCPGCGSTMARVVNGQIFCTRTLRAYDMTKSVSKKSKSIYLIGALKNRAIMKLGNELRSHGFDVFDDWLTPGPEADAFLLEYERHRGRGYKAALKGYAAQHNFAFDKAHIDRCDMAIMCMPCGKSGHLELGYVIGCGKPGFILFDAEPDRMDLMYNFATDIFFSQEELINALEAI
jgi:nucleoside 2-deoxyribosyltransferase